MDYFLEASAFLSSAFAGAAVAAPLLVSAGLLSFFLANFMSVLGASVLAGAAAVAAGAVAAGATVAGAFAGSAAKTVNDNADRVAITNVFILSFLYVNEVDFYCLHIYNASAVGFVDNYLASAPTSTNYCGTTVALTWFRSLSFWGFTQSRMLIIFFSGIS
jgi:hypothetical protein